MLVGYLRAFPGTEHADEAVEDFPVIHVFHRVSFLRDSASGSRYFTSPLMKTQFFSPALEEAVQL
jgi:hypothetical protein